MEMKEKQDVEKLLREGNTVQFPPTGWSMYPLIIGGRDQVVVAPVGEKPFKKGDVLLYRRPGSILILHRLVKRKPEGLYFTGDNQTEIEGPLPESAVAGRLVGYVRKGKNHTTKNVLYRVYSGLWLLALPFRPAAWAFMRGVRKLFGRKG